MNIQTETTNNLILVYFNLEIMKEDKIINVIENKSNKIV